MKLMTRTQKLDAVDGWQACLAGYTMSTAMSWLTSPDIFGTQSTYRVFNSLPRSQHTMAALLATYSVASIITVLRGSETLRSAMAVLGSVIWTFIGSAMLLSSLQSAPRFISPNGVFELFAALGSLVFISQWSSK